MDEGVRSALRAKYLDWCSARIAERFLALDPEEIYALARPAERAEAGLSAPGPAGGGSGPESYRVLVQRVTAVLLERMRLPSLEEWSRSYAEDPGGYDAEMLGFWKDASGGGRSSA